VSSKNSDDCVKLVVSDLGPNQPIVEVWPAEEAMKRLGIELPPGCNLCIIVNRQRGTWEICNAMKIIQDTPEIPERLANLFLTEEDNY
jgi:hypothetical protein